MEGMLFIPPDRPTRDPEQVCTDCGQAFRPRQVPDGVEQLCDDCYGAQFESARLRGWEWPQRLAAPAR